MIQDLFDIFKLFAIGCAAIVMLYALPFILVRIAESDTPPPSEVDWIGAGYEPLDPVTAGEKKP